MRTLGTLTCALLILTGSSIAQTCPFAPVGENFDGATPGSTGCGLATPGTLPAGWTLDAASTNAWRVHTGATASAQTGPSSDRNHRRGRCLRG